MFCKRSGPGLRDGRYAWLSPAVHRPRFATGWRGMREGADPYRGRPRASSPLAGQRMAPRRLFTTAFRATSAVERRSHREHATSSIVILPATSPSVTASLVNGALTLREAPKTPTHCAGICLMRQVDWFIAAPLS